MVSPVVMYGCESWTVKKAEHWRIDASELWCWRRLVSPLDYKEIQPVHSKGDQSWVFIGRTHAKADTPILWPPDAKSWLIGKDSDAGRGWGQEEKGKTEDEMAGWHHQLDGHECGWTPGVGDGQGGLASCNHGVAKSQTWLSDWTELKRKELEKMHIIHPLRRNYSFPFCLFLELFLSLNPLNLASISILHWNRSYEGH